jgi:AcrR family transcriptional regulator
MSAQPVRERRSRVEQTAATQRRILDATIEVLVEKGYSGTSTLEGQQRAGVSRGSLLHHYASRTDLLVAAIEHLTRERINDLPLVRSQAPSTGRDEWAVRTLWGTFQGPLYAASLELWTAARHDPDLAAALLPQERIMGQFIRSTWSDLFGEELTAHPGFAEAFEILIDAMRGAAARAVLRTAESDERLLAGWIRLMRGLLSPA